MSVDSSVSRSTEIAPVTRVYYPRWVDRLGVWRAAPWYGLSFAIHAILLTTVWLLSPERPPPETIRRAMAIGRKAGLRFVYGGNIADTETPTFCPKCAAALIRREAFHVRENLCAENLRANGGICPACGTKIYGRFD